jgi:hypothetical protein
MTAGARNESAEMCRAANVLAYVNGSASYLPGLDAAGLSH